MSVQNPVFEKLQKAISPIISIGVGSAIIKCCSKLDLNPNNLEEKDLPALKNTILEHYQNFWKNKLHEIESALNELN